MRRYTVRINDTDYVLDVEELAHDTFTVHLPDGQLVDVVLTDHQDLAQAVIAPQIEVGQPHPPAAAPVARELPAPAAVGAAPARRVAPRGRGAQAVTAPMPGVVLSVEVAPGASVARGQTLLVLEAMKMKNEIKADRDGVVAGIPVGVGDQVRHGDLLVEFEG